MERDGVGGKVRLGAETEVSQVVAVGDVVGVLELQDLLDEGVQVAVEVIHGLLRFPREHHLPISVLAGEQIAEGGPWSARDIKGNESAGQRG